MCSTRKLLDEKPAHGRKTILQPWIDRHRQHLTERGIDSVIVALRQSTSLTAFLRVNGNDSIRCCFGLVAPLGLTGECYISHWATRFGKDSNPGCQNQRPKTNHFNQLCHQAPFLRVNSFTTHTVTKYIINFMSVTCLQSHHLNKMLSTNDSLFSSVSFFLKQHLRLFSHLF